MTRRRAFTRKIKSAAIKRAGGHCEKCKAVLKKGEAEYDHILPFELGGESTLANCQILCRPCHKEKTGKKDVPRIRKSDRQRDKDIGAIKPKGEIKNRGFQKKQRKDKLPVPGPRRLFTEKEQ